jgi:hypothetical protein
VLDEDNMASDSDTAVPTQQSTKAYVDTSVSAAGGSISTIVTQPGTGGGDETIAGTTEVETSHQISITPPTASHKVRIMWSGTLKPKTDGGSHTVRAGTANCHRDSTGGAGNPPNGTALGPRLYGRNLIANSTSNAPSLGPCVFLWEDTPASASAKTYTLTIKNNHADCDTDYENAAADKSLFTAECYL